MKKFFATLVLICFSVLSLGDPVLAERPGRPAPSRPDKPAPSRPDKPAPPRQDKPAPPRQDRPAPSRQDRPAPPRPGRPAPSRPDRPLPPPRPRPQPDRPNRPLPPPRPRPNRPRPPYPYPPRYPYYYYDRSPFWGLLWGIPMIARGIESAQNDRDRDRINITINNYNDKSTPTRFKLSNAMEKKALDVEKLAQKLKDEMERENVDKLRAMRLYSEIRKESQEISDWSFSEYLRIADDIPPGAEFSEPMEIPEDIPQDIKERMKSMQKIGNSLRVQLKKRPVDKVKALNLYYEVRNEGMEIADERFYKYLDSVD